MGIYIEPAGQGWKIEKQDGRVVLVRRFALMATPTMVVTTYAAPGLRDWFNEAGEAYAVSEQRNGQLCIVGNVYRPIPLERPQSEPVSQVEEVIKPPRGKWRWSSCGRWHNIAKR